MKVKVARVSIPILLLSISSAWGFFFTVNVGADVLISNPEIIPVDRVAICQLMGGGGALQSRHTSSNDWKGIGQAFTWNRAADLDGVGFYMDDATFTSDQQHWFILQKLDGSGGPVTSTVYQAQFTLSSTNVGADRWIYFDVENQAMVNGQDYGVTLVAAEDAIIGGQAIHWACSSDSSAYEEGDANQMDIPTRGLPPSSSHDFVTSAKRDTVFYLQASRVSNPASIPLERIAVSQLVAGGVNLQARNTSASDWRGVAQSVLWTTDSALDGIGVYLSSAQTTWFSDQQYVLVVQALDGYRGEGTATVAQVEFALRKEDVGASRWLHINLDNLSLIGGEWYGFMLAPTESAVGSNRLYVETTASTVDTLYGDGSANQFHLDVRGMPPAGDYGTAREDLVFYMDIPMFPSAWLPAGNEKEEVVDSSSGRTVHYLTAGESIDTHFHYHGGTWGWIYEKEYLFFSSSRNRPLGAGATVEGERQIMAADPDSGDLYYLTTIPRMTNGSFSHINTRAYYSTYNDVAQAVFFFDKTTRSKLYAYNCLSGEQSLILTLPSPGVGSTEMDDFVDSQSVRILYSYTTSTSTGNVYSTAFADFDRDFNLLTNNIIREVPPGEFLNHAAICPTDKNLIFYQYKHGDPLVTDFIVRNLLTGTEVLIKPDSQLIDHQVWGASGEAIYWDNNTYQDNLYAYELATSNTVQFGGTSSNSFYAGHNKLDSHERLWVYDYMEYGKSGTTALYIGTDEYGVSVENWNGSIWMYDRQTAARELYANIVWAHPHPRHPHTVFSTENSMISFVTGTAETNANTRVAVMQVSEE